MLFKEVADAFAASRQWDSASLGRLAFWVECLGEREFASVTVDDVDDALVRLGRARSIACRPLCDRAQRSSTEGRNDQSLRRHARLGLQVRASCATSSRVTSVAPTRGIEKLPEPVDPDRYLRQEEVERILACARVVDRHWKRLPALIVLALHTGLRKGSLLKLKWESVDLGARRWCSAVPRTASRSARP